MKIPTHDGGVRISAEQVRWVLDHAREYSGRQWAEFFKVHPQTIKTWRAKGMALDLWASPSSRQWDAVKAEAVSCLWRILNALEGR